MLTVENTDNEKSRGRKTNLPGCPEVAEEPWGAASQALSLLGHYVPAPEQAWHTGGVGRIISVNLSPAFTPLPCCMSPSHHCKPVGSGSMSPEVTHLSPS